MIKKRASLDQKGSLLGVALIALIVFSTIGAGLIMYTTTQYTTTHRSVFTANALLVAEAGIEESVFQLNQDDNYAGSDAERVFFDNEQQGRGVFETTVEPMEDSNARTIIATGKVYRYGTNELVNTRKIKVTVVGTGSEGYSVHSGPGGLILGGSASITNSDVYVNGKIQMSGAAKIGTPSQPVDVRVAHQACPAGNNPGPTYPQTCSTGQPITLAWSTHIYGDVCATGQTSYGPDPAGNILPGNGGQGLMLGCVAPPITPPSYNRDAHIGRMAVTANANDINYNCSQWRNPDGFKRTWPANIRLNGNVNAGSSCDLTIMGDVYITGNLDIGGAATIRVDDSVGMNRPVVVVDGTINAAGSGQIIANSSGTGIHFISFRSNASCNPNCATITGNELKNTQNLQTVNVGGGANLPGIIFQSYWGRVTVAGSGNVGAAVGQTVDLSGAGTVTFGTQLSSGARSWTISSYQRLYD
jgi:hypothetical protein